MLAGQQGLALAAPPRAGKGTGVVIPNLLNWPDSVICVDIKRENWTLTSGFRAAHGQSCFLFDPFSEDGRTARWNPFHYVSEDPLKRVNDLQRIAEMLYPDPSGPQVRAPCSWGSLYISSRPHRCRRPSVRCCGRGWPQTTRGLVSTGNASLRDATAEGFRCRHSVSERFTT